MDEHEKVAVAAACRAFVERCGEEEEEEEEEEEKEEGGRGLDLGKPLTLAKVHHAFGVLRRMVWTAAANKKKKKEDKEEKEEEEEGRRTHRHTDPSPAASSTPLAAAPRPSQLPPTPFLPASHPQDPAQALAFFRTHHYQHRDALEEDTRLLKARYGEAKRLGETVQRSRDSIACLRKVAEQLRRWKEEEEEQEEEQEEGEGGKDNALVAEEEAKVLRELEQEKEKYQSAYHQLKDLKGEVERIQQTLERHRARLRGEFEAWLAHATTAAAPKEEEEEQRQPEEEEEEEAGMTYIQEDMGREEEDQEEEEEEEEGVPVAAAPSSSPPRKSSLTATALQATAPPLSNGGEVEGEVEDDIAAFYKAKEELLAMRQQQVEQYASWFVG